MTEIIRHCPDCGQDRPFEQHHSTSGRCCDAGSANCPEWYCLSCGAGLLIGDVPAAADTASRDRAVFGRARGRALAVGIRDRVA